MKELISIKREDIRLGSLYLEDELINIIIYKKLRGNKIQELSNNNIYDLELGNNTSGLYVKDNVSLEPLLNIMGLPTILIKDDMNNINESIANYNSLLDIIECISTYNYIDDKLDKTIETIISLEPLIISNSYQKKIIR